MRATCETHACDGSDSIYRKGLWLMAHASTALFVLLWSSAAIFAKLGLTHSSTFAFLTLRFALASGVLWLLGFRRDWLPLPGTRVHVAATGLLLIGSYSICCLLALDYGLTPGVLATILGVQPILTLLLMERRFSMARLGGLALALLGLILVVWQSIGRASVTAQFSFAGMLFALGALASMTSGAIL